MRGVVAAALVTIALGAGCASAPTMTPAPAEPPRIGKPARGAPSWLPAYSEAQLALLAPVDERVESRANRVFPDLRRFAYAGPARLEDLRRTLRFSSMVATVLDKSPRLYWFEKTNPALANVVAQYGPAPSPEPDPWVAPKGGVLAPVRIDPHVTALREDARAKGAAGDLKGAAKSLREAFIIGNIAALGLELGDTLVAIKDTNGARAAYEHALDLDPTLATAHLRLAELAEQENDRDTAKHRVAEAIAYWPASPRARALADRLSGGRASRSRALLPTFPIFLDVDSGGAIHIGFTGGEVERIYAGCRAVLRYEPELRARIFDQPNSVPYHLSMIEELVCLESAIGAYVADRATNDAWKPDPEMDALVEIAHVQGLGGYVMTEILGVHRPERARVAPRDVHRAMVKYVEGQLLGTPLVADPKQGVYTASR